MADTGMWDKFKSAFDDPQPTTKTPVRELDPDKAKAFSSVFNGESEAGQDDAITRRLKKLTGNY